MPVKVTYAYHHSNIIHNFCHNIRTTVISVRAGIVGKLYPDDELKAKLPQQFGNARLIWNKFCGWLKKQYQVRKTYCK